MGHIATDQSEGSYFSPDGEKKEGGGNDLVDAGRICDGRISPMLTPEKLRKKNQSD